MSNHGANVDSYVSSRQVGAATVTVVSDGELLWAPRFAVPEAAWRAAMPDADESGRVWFGLNVVLIELGDARIVVDPALDDPGTTFEQKVMRGSGPPGIAFARSPGLAAALDAVGWAPESVTHVVITHAHDDHYGGVMVQRGDALVVRFPNAKHFIGRADWEDNPKHAQADSELHRRVGAV